MKKKIYITILAYKNPQQCFKISRYKPNIILLQPRFMRSAVQAVEELQQRVKRKCNVCSVQCGVYCDSQMVNACARLFECRLPELIVPRVMRAYLRIMYIIYITKIIIIIINEIGSHKRGVVVNKSRTMIAFVINVNNDEY